MANMTEWVIRKDCEQDSLGWPLTGLAPLAPAKPARITSAKEPRRTAGEKN